MPRKRTRRRALPRSRTATPLRWTPVPISGCTWGLGSFAVWSGSGPGDRSDGRGRTENPSERGRAPKADTKKTEADDDARWSDGGGRSAPRRSITPRPRPNGALPSATAGPSWATRARGAISPPMACRTSTGCEVPGGDFLFREQKVSAFVDAFQIARYPITNAQYQAFIDSGGYRTDRWWVGLAQRVEQPPVPRWSQPNRPRTDVSWFEAVAFCRWLSSALAMEIRLPTETEWEKAARGTDGREYPWGDGTSRASPTSTKRIENAGPNYVQKPRRSASTPTGRPPTECWTSPATSGNGV